MTFEDNFDVCVTLISSAPPALIHREELELVYNASGADDRIARRRAETPREKMNKSETKKDRRPGRRDDDEASRKVYAKAARGGDSSGCVGDISLGTSSTVSTTESAEAEERARGRGRGERPREPEGPTTANGAADRALVAQRKLGGSQRRQERHRPAATHPSAAQQRRRSAPPLRVRELRSRRARELFSHHTSSYAANEIFVSHQSWDVGPSPKLPNGTAAASAPGPPPLCTVRTFDSQHSLADEDDSTPAPTTFGGCASLCGSHETICLPMIL